MWPGLAADLNWLICVIVTPVCPAGRVWLLCFPFFLVNLATVVAVTSGLRRLPGSASEQTRGVCDGLQALCRRRFQIVSPHLSPSCCRPPTGQWGYRAAGTGCLAHKTDTRPCTLVIIYTSLLGTRKRGKNTEAPQCRLDARSSSSLIRQRWRKLKQ